MKPELQDAIQRYGALAWEAAVRQVALETTMNGWLAIAFATLLALAMGVMLSYRKYHDREELVVLGGIGSIFFTVFGAISLAEWYMRSNNPMFYAIKRLIGD